MMKRKNKIEYLVLTALMIILGTQKTLAQSDSVIVKPDIVYSTDRKTYLLGGFVVDGIKGYDDEVLRNISGLEVGQAITVPGDDISRVLHRYWDQKIFSDVTIAADSIVGHKIYLHITLAARPKISTISYHGVKKSEREDIEERLGLRSGSQISPDIVDRAKIIIKRYFEEKGYKNAIIEIVQKDDVSATNQVIVDVNIDKNEKIKVKHIYFTGVKKEYVKKLKRAMKKTHEVNKLYNLFKSKKFLPEEYEKDKGLIIDKYNEWGYRDAIINTDSVVPYDEKHVDIYINIDEGNKYYLRNVEWVGNSVYSSESLAQALKMKRGDVYQANLDPVIGSEQGGIRPVVIIQNDRGNRYSPTVIVVAVTTRRKKPQLPVHVLLTREESGLKEDSIVLTEQVRTLEKTRLTRYLGTVTAQAMKRIDRALGMSIGST